MGASGAVRAILSRPRETTSHGVTRTLHHSADTASVRDEDTLFFFRCSGRRFQFLGHCRDALPRQTIRPLRSPAVGSLTNRD